MPSETLTEEKPNNNNNSHFEVLSVTEDPLTQDLEAVIKFKPNTTKTNYKHLIMWNIDDNRLKISDTFKASVTHFIDKRPQHHNNGKQLFEQTLISAYDSEEQKAYPTNIIYYSQRALTLDEILYTLENTTTQV